MNTMLIIAGSFIAGAIFMGVLMLVTASIQARENATAKLDRD